MTAALFATPAEKIAAWRAVHTRTKDKQISVTRRSVGAVLEHFNPAVQAEAERKALLQLPEPYPVIFEAVVRVLWRTQKLMKTDPIAKAIRRSGTDTKQAVEQLEKSGILVRYELGWDLTPIGVAFVKQLGAEP